MELGHGPVHNLGGPGAAPEPVDLGVASLDAGAVPAHDLRREVLQLAQAPALGDRGDGGAVLVVADELEVGVGRGLVGVHHEAGQRGAQAPGDGLGEFAVGGVLLLAGKLLEEPLHLVAERHDPSNTYTGVGLHGALRGALRAPPLALAAQLDARPGLDQDAVEMRPVRVHIGGLGPEAQVVGALATGARGRGRLDPHLGGAGVGGGGAAR